MGILLFRFSNKSNNMWIVQCKANNDSQTWATLGSYGNKVSAITHASRVTGECFMVIVIDPDGDVIWSS